MPHDASKSTTRQRGTMLTSTAWLLATMTFFAGLLIGTALPRDHSAPPPPAPAAAPADEQADEQAAHIAQVREEIARNPDEPLNWIHLGNLYFDAHDAPQAIAAYEKALELKPDDADVMTDLGTMYRLAQKPQQALDLYERVLVLNPEHQNARFNKGVLLAIDLARPAEAMAAWRDLLARKPDAVIGEDTPLASVLAPLITDAGHELHQRGNHAAALEAYEEALRVDPAFAPAREARDALLQQSENAGTAQSSPPSSTTPEHP